MEIGKHYNQGFIFTEEHSRHASFLFTIHW